MVELLECEDISLWKKSLAVYKDVVQLIDDQKRKRKGNKKDEENLVSLDQWFQEEVPSLVTSRDPPHLTHSELSRLMKWKLMRGKFRPRLTELIQLNDVEKVQELTSKAYSELPNLQKAIETLKTLKAVGPATASAILCVYSPQQAPFMCDEAVLAIKDIGRLDYSLKQYMTFAEIMIEKAQDLNKMSVTGDDKWNAHNVELALWAFHFAKRIKPDILEESKESGGIRNDTNSSDSEDSPPPTKKCK